MKRLVNLNELNEKDISIWPRITVVTPTYERAEYLEKAILSVLNQNYPNLEYIIVDGGSKNKRVLEIIRKYEDKLAWWVSEPDRGHAEAIKKGFDRSTGEILAWLCSDDMYLPGALRAAGEVFARWPQTEVVFGNTHVIDKDGNFVREFRAVPYSRLSFFTASGFHQPSAFWRRSLYDRAGGNVGGANLEYNVYEPNVDLFFRFVNADARFMFLRTPICSVRVHPDQTCSREAKKVREYRWKALRREFPFWSKPGIYQTCRFLMRIRQLVWYLLQGDLVYIVSAVIGKFRTCGRWWSFLCYDDRPPIS